MSQFVDDILREVISKNDRDLQIISRPSNNKIEVCNLKWSGLFPQLLADGKLVDVININGNVIEFSKDVSNVYKFKIPDVVFWIGTELKTSSEWQNYGHDLRKKIPFIWCNLTSSLTFDIDIDSTSPIKESYRGVEIFFVGDFNKSQWNTNTTLNERTKLLKEWSEEFVNAFDLIMDTDLTDNPKGVAFPEFGRYTKEGAVKQIIDENLSAIGLSISFETTREERKC